MDLLISGGFILLAIAVLSVYAVYLFFVRLFKLARERLDTEELMVRVNAAVRDRDLDLALEACEQHGGPVARVLQAALLRLPYGRQAVEAAFAEASLLEEQSLTRGLRPLATIAQVAPLLGLLGTVTGMIIAFGEISASGNETLTFVTSATTLYLGIYNDSRAAGTATLTIAIGPVATPEPPTTPEGEQFLAVVPGRPVPVSQGQ